MNDPLATNVGAVARRADDTPRREGGDTLGGELQVRCPHCRSSIGVGAETPLEAITCSSCGSEFDLVNDRNATWAAPTFTQLGRFEIVDKVGEGSFGFVWKARDPQLDRTVALKTPRRSALAGADVEGFFREARAAAQLKHPHIVSVHEVGRDGETVYIVSDFVRGAALSEWVAIKPPTIREAAEMCAKIADALHHAHERGIVHRDLKPGNVMIDAEGEPHVMDFGLARRDRGEIQMTMEGQVLGTPAYMSPEQAAGASHVADRRSDVYSLGVMLFELATGELPFRGSKSMLLHQVVHDEPPSPRKFNGAVPRDIETIVLKCLEKKAEKRYQSAAELRDELKRYLGGEPIVSRPVTWMERGWRKCRRHPVAAGLGAALGLALVGLAAGGSAAAIYQATLKSEMEEAFHALDATNDTLHEETTKLLFSHGNMTYAAGGLQAGCEEIFRAWTMRSPKDPLKAAYARILADRLTRGQRSQPLLRTAPKGYEPSYFAGVSAVAYSPDGSRVATGSSDGVVRLWNASTGQPIGAAKGHNGSIGSIAFTPDSQRVMTGGGDNAARLWDAATCQPVGDTMQHAAAVSSIVISPDGLRAATGSWDKTARVWDARTGQPAGEPLRHEFNVNAVAFSRDGAKLATGSARIEVWDLAAGKSLAALGEPSNVNSIAISPDGARVLAGSYDGAVRVWDMETGQAVGEARHAGPVTCVAYSADGKRALSGSNDGTAQVWDARTLAAVGAPLRHEDTVNAVAFDPAGERVLTASRDGSAQLWEVATGREIGDPMRHDSPVSAIAFSPDGARVLTGPSEGASRMWDAAADKAAQVLVQRAGRIKSLRLVADGTRVAADWEKVAQLVDPVSGEALGGPVRHEIQDFAVFSPDGAHALTGLWTFEAHVWNALSGEAVGAAIPHEGFFKAAEFSADGSRLVTGSTDDTARVWDAATGLPAGPPLEHQDDVDAVAISRDGRRVVTGSNDDTARLWDAATGKPLGEPMRHEGDVRCVALSPDGKTVLTGSSDKSARLWHAATGRPASGPMLHQGGVQFVAFSGDGKLVVTVSAGVAQVWDARTGAGVGEPIRHFGRPLNSVEFTPDGTRLLTCSSDGTARLWDTVTGMTLGEAMHHASPVSAAAFTAAGRGVIAGCGDGAVTAWEASEMPTPREELAWFELLLGKRLDAAHGFRTLSEKEIVSRWQKLEQDGDWVASMREFRNRRGKWAAGN